MIKSQQALVDVQPDKISVAKRAANWLIEQLSEDRERFALCLSGGQTPALLYETLAMPEFASRIPWTKLHLFWGDERFVPQTDDLSNYKMVKTTLLDNVPIPPNNVHPINTALKNAEEAAIAYEQELQKFYGDKVLKQKQFLFDVTLLGLGSDGHTASLFPGSPVLSEKSAWVKPVIGVKPEDRVTLTYPAIESSRSTAFLVTGLNKYAILKQVLNGNEKLPAGKLKPEGNLYWFLDQTAYLSSQ